MARRGGRSSAVSASGYGAGDSGAAALVADIVAAAGSDALALYLARDSATYRTSGTDTEVATWIDQIGSADATQSTASKRPDMDAGNGPAGRDRLSFDLASVHLLSTGAAFSRTSGDRMWMMYIAQAKTADTTQQRHVSFHNTVIALTLGLQFSGNFLQQAHDGTAENITTAAEDTSLHRHENWMASPHVGIIDGSSTDGTRTGGISGNQTLTLNIGAGRSDNFHSDMYMMFVMVGVIGSGTAIPSWAPTVRGYLSTYYGGEV